MKVARTVLSGGKDGDNFKVLPIATVCIKKEHLVWVPKWSVQNDQDNYLPPFYLYVSNTKTV
ncbi:hypothetical protein [Bacillus cereus group sp. MYBK95-2]|uniref:hypothetical protein n=1 Tax=Bacillus cereus group sp. MYBK95-2 TaxID=3450599 RepID=UPI003F79E474